MSEQQVFGAALFVGLGLIAYLLEKITKQLFEIYRLLEHQNRLLAHQMGLGQVDDD